MFKELAYNSVFIKPQTRTIRFSNVNKTSMGRKVLVVFLALLNIGLLFFYILGINNNASIGYEIKTYQNKISVLGQENKKLTLLISEQASVNSLQILLSASGYSVVSQTKYITPPSAVTMK